MRFVPSGDEYSVERMTYRGEGGWPYPLDAGSLKTLGGKYVKVLGTDDFFDLM